MFADHSWLDDQTRRKALDKLEAMRYYIGFPDWILQDDILDEEVGFDSSKTDDSLQVVKGHYASSYYNLVRIGNGAEFRKVKVKKSLPSERYFIFSYGGGMALYSLLYNALAITFAFLSDGSWFDVDYPAAINYGSIGSIIGHEIFHGFDNDGRLYDKHGHKTNWWTDSASEHFHNLSQCFLNQYDGIVDPVTGIKVNAKNSTITYAILKNDVHPSNDIRTRKTLSNIAPMAQAFNCPVGSPMNPKNKCSIW